MDAGSLCVHVSCLPKSETIFRKARCLAARFATPSRQITVIVGTFVGIGSEYDGKQPGVDTEMHENRRGYSIALIGNGYS